ncbi:ORF55 [callitrichine gammaherpesvirus 3]|uniref:Ribonucleoside-diphosphate reductase n=1 Tax=callitrichine gammaherpesvirus 3 TaxID=106331 RepID=Q993F4_9GAMA|nr:ORF55 [callitrichine gammaherpesvirus 3]AAK38264.1 ORF55 [callitrichine gammaherpesvirus 3]
MKDSTCVCSGEGVRIEQLINDLKVQANSDPEANILAGRLLHRLKSPLTTKTVSDYLLCFGPLLAENVLLFIQDHLDELEDRLSSFQRGEVYDRLLGRGYLSALRYYDTYLNVTTDGVYESIPHAYMRVAAFCASITLHFEGMRLAMKAMCPHLSDILSIFDYFFEHLTLQTVCCSTPILRSAGIRKQILASCFIMSPRMESEAAVNLAMMRDLGRLLQHKSGVGMGVTDFGRDGKHIGLLLKMVNSHVEYHNYANKRPVSVAAFMEVWHSQVFKFLEAKVPENPERCAGIFTGLCIPHMFFKLYKEKPWSFWHLFEPQNAGRLESLYGEEFEREYYRLIKEGKSYGSVPIKSLMFSIVNSAIKAGSPYILLKEACNEHYWRDLSGEAMSAGNLCAEVLQPSRDEIAVCNLASVCLPRCLTGPLTTGPVHGLMGPERKSGHELLRGLQETYDPIEAVDLPTGDFSLKILRDAVQCAVFLVNCAIQAGSPTWEARDVASMGIGVQGLADVFSALGWHYTDPSSRALNSRIFEEMYFTALCTSNTIAEHSRRMFSGFSRSKYASGWFHWHDWPDTITSLEPEVWETLAGRIKEHGLFNSQFIALMPTAGVAQLTGVSDSFYPFFANASTKVTSKEEALRPNQTFWRHLRVDHANEAVRVGCKVEAMPEPLRTHYSIFKTAFDYPQEDLIRMSRDRAPFVDQSQSLTLFLKERDASRASMLVRLLLLGWELGLKTIMYYCRVEKEADMGVYECRKADPRAEDEVVEHESDDTEVCKSGVVETKYKYYELFDVDTVEDVEPNCMSCQ